MSQPCSAVFNAGAAAVTDSGVTDNVEAIYTVSKILEVYVPPIIAILGIVGNIISFRINNLPNYRNNTTCIYMKGLAISGHPVFDSIRFSADSHVYHIRRNQSFSLF